MRYIVKTAREIKRGVRMLKEKKKEALRLESAANVLFDLLSNKEDGELVKYCVGVLRKRGFIDAEIRHAVEKLEVSEFVENRVSYWVLPFKERM